MNNEVLKKPKIEAIYPLSIMQTGLLFHYLTEEDDQGFLNVQCTIDGELNIEILKKSWQLAIERHSVLRTSVHWEKIKKPIQLVKPNGFIEWDILDWSEVSPSNQSEKLNTFKKSNRLNGVDLQKNPLSKISLIKTKTDSFYLVWCCHHLLLDGWSTSIILKDVFATYDALIANRIPELDHIPSYKSYLNWLKKLDINDAEVFWKATFNNYNNPFLFNEEQHKIKPVVQNHIELSKDITLKTQALAKTYQTTLNTLFQGLWAIILSKYSSTLDVAYGNTVSGRSGNFPNIERMSGMFTNVIPVRTQLELHLNVKDWLKSIQSQQLEARKYEHITLSEITEWVDPYINSLFDSLFIFENFPWHDIEAGNLKVHSFESGITTTYPLTATIKTGEVISIALLSDETLFSDEQNFWILKRFEEIIEILVENKEISIDSLLRNITPTITKNIIQTEVAKVKSFNIVAPKNKKEIQLLEIWQKLLHKNNISSDDNFFEIGGKSLLAVRMFSMIKNKMDIQLSPTSILEYPTITSLAKKINEESGLTTVDWNNLVPIRSEGDREPIFCLHAGGGHVFFYNGLAKYLDKNRPVYAIQPSGLYGERPNHTSIEEMAIDYVKEIREAYPEGPYNLLVYCHSTAVGFEMSNILKSMGQKPNLIVMDTMAEQEHITSERLKMRFLGFLNRLLKKPVNVIEIMISYRYKKYIKPFFINILGSTEAKNTSVTTVNLINIYNKYKWKSYDLDIILVLTKKVNNIFNREISESWNKIATNVTTVHIEGDHRTLFEDHNVKFVAKMLDEHIN